jgi:hypothetical protein
MVHILLHGIFIKVSRISKYTPQNVHAIPSATVVFAVALKGSNLVLTARTDVIGLFRNTTQSDPWKI